jgi:hypothetical protein
MLFQTLDEKKKCVAVYRDGELIYNQVPDDLTTTWKYTSFLDALDIEYANLYCVDKSIDEMCPENIKDKWEDINKKLKAFLISFNEAGVSLHDNCFFDLVPERFLLEYCDLKNKITENVIKTHDKPQNYEFLLELTRVLESIKYQRLNLNFRKMDKHLGSLANRNQFKKLTSCSPYISYDIAGTKTGRLTTTKNAFPILTLNKSYRSVIEPTNDWLIELDFNAAELRTLLALSGKEQPEQDIHEWNVKNVYGGSVSREEAKKRIFAWLYNPNSKDSLSASAYDRAGVVSKFWQGTSVKTIFNRDIPSDKHHALNYIIQSTTSDLFLRRMIEVHKLLADKKSFISFSVHDSLVIDLAEEEKDILTRIVDVFSETDLGKFKVNLSAGKDYSNMRKLI